MDLFRFLVFFLRYFINKYLCKLQQSPAYNSHHPYEETKTLLSCLNNRVNNDPVCANNDPVCDNNDPLCADNDQLFDNNQTNHGNKIS